MQLTIRPFRDQDAAAVVTLWREAFPNDPPRNDPVAILQRVHPGSLLVGELGTRIVAAVIAGYDGHRGWIYHLAVAASERRKGIGRAMMAAAEQRLRAVGCPKVNLQVYRWNAEVVGFYERLGYSVEDRISMGKQLA
jgi:ribosomal protein S18 acetylase RimI-like enzyme